MSIDDIAAAANAVASFARDAAYKTAIIAPALIGGAVDYANQVARGVRVPGFIDFVVHSVSAVFFGWMLGLLAGEHGMGQSAVTAAIGFGGYMGTRTADFLFGYRKKK